MQSIKSYFASLILLCNIFACDQAKKEPPVVTDGAVSVTKTEALPDTTAAAQPNIKLGVLEESLINAGLINVQSLDSNIRVDLKYSSEDNFVGVDVYGELELCYLQPAVAQKVAQAQAILSKIKPGYHLLIYDGARPLQVQQILWDTLAKPEEIKHLYVANPEEGSIHNYGSAVDLTISDSGQVPLDMGTAYDYFGELAYPNKEEDLLASGALTKYQVENRRLLRDIMLQVGFTPINTEWWHFNAHSRKRAMELYTIIP